MAVSPKTTRGKPGTKAASGTLSASELLKAAETAIGDAPAKTVAPAPSKPAPRKMPVAKAPVAKAPAPKPAVAKAPVAKPPVVEAKPAPVAEPKTVIEPKAVVEPAPAAVVAATTAVDAAPEPAVASAPPIKTVFSKTGTAVPPVLTPALEGNLTMNDMIETGKKFAEDTKAKMETVYADMNEKAKAGVEKSTKAIEELSDIAKGNVEAIVESGKIAAKGMETLGQEAVDYSRKNFEKATASFKSFSTIKTPTEFFQLQSQLLSSSFDEFTKEAAKSSEALMKLAGDVAQPLTARVTLVTDKVKALAA